MIRYLKPTVSFIIILSFPGSSYSQQPANYPDFIAEKFNRYCKALPREEIYVHTDREDYIAGENLWFNIYLIDRQSAKPSGNSKIAYFEVLNPENRPVIQKRIKLEKGFGPGQIVLPDTLSNGKYTLRAYTNWMKNFLPDNCFMKNINIYNALRSQTYKGKLNYDNLNKKKTGSENNQETDDSGLSLIVDNLKADNLDILISSSENYRSGNGNLFYLFIQTHGIISHKTAERITGENTKITIPKKELIPGVNHITIFDSKGQPVCERFIYTPVKNIEFFTIKSPDSCKTRDKISLELEPDRELVSASGTTNLSISIALNSDSREMMNLADYMIFGSEFGILPWKSIRNENNDKLRLNVLDSILSTVKSNWINWKAILSEDIPSFRYRIENDDEYLYGKLVALKTQVAQPDKLLFLSTPGKEAIFKYARTDNEGNFNFNIQIDEGVKDIIIQPENVENSTVKIESPFSKEYLQSEMVPVASGIDIPTSISKMSVNYQVGKIYESSALGSPLTSITLPSKPKRFYGKPDIELIMADYIKLPVMQEVFFELLPGVFLKSKKSRYEISIADPVDNIVFDEKPLLLIDGVIINDPSLIANLDPEIVEKIDVVKEKYLVGEYLFYGLVNVITKAGDYSIVALPDYAVRLSYKIFDPVVSFSSPVYSIPEMKSSRIPDFRNTLYWNASLKPDKDGKIRVEFWASDNISDYIINIQGITGEGKTISLKKQIKVQ